MTGSISILSIYPFNRTSMESKLTETTPVLVKLRATFNRTSMESKRALADGFTGGSALLIEPVWNRNVITEITNAERELHF